MRKASESFPGGKYERSEVSLRLYRGALEATRNLEEKLQASPQCLLSTELTNLRMRLKDYCERLMFSNPLEYGRKAEELIWRKVYYDVIQRLKEQRKKKQGNIDDFSIQSHLLAGMGYYNHLLSRIQMEFQFDLDGIIDTPFLWQQKGIKRERWQKHQQSMKVDDKLKNWANQAGHRSILCLGDLARYMGDLGVTEWYQTAERYYNQARCLDPGIGMPHNQLGTLFGMKNYGCDATYHYLLCLTSPVTFEGAEGNLKRVFEKNNHLLSDCLMEESSTRSFVVKRFVMKFLLLTENFFIGSDDNSMQNLCQEVLIYFDKCLRLNLCFDGNISAEDFDPSKPESLTDNLIFKMTIISLISLFRLQKARNNLLSAATAFMLTWLSHLLLYSHNKLCIGLFPQAHQKSFKTNLAVIYSESDSATETQNTPDLTPMLTPQSPVFVDRQDNSDNKGDRRLRKNKREQGLLRKLRRRRKVSSTSQEDSELSEGETIEPCMSDNEDRIDLFGASSDNSENGDYSSCSSSEHEPDDEDELNNFNESIETELLSSGSPETNNNLKLSLSESRESVSEAKKIENSPSSKINGLNHGSEFDCWSLQNSLLHISPDDENLDLSTREIFHVMNNEGSLNSIKILLDWLQNQKDIIAVCAEDTKPLWIHLLDLLNLFLKIETKIFDGSDAAFGKLQALKRVGAENWKQVYPLTEDIALQKNPLLEDIHCNLDFDRKQKSLSSVEKIYLRCQSILNFGFYLTTVTKIGVTFSDEKKKFEYDQKPVSETNGMSSPDVEEGEAGEGQRKRMMRNMAQLWLKSEVNDLEVLVELNASPQLSPYLIPDTNVLCHQLPLMKQLIGTKRFILIVPSIVISSLDQLKRESVAAREAIRWLESELRRGSRYLRAQKIQEKLSLSPVTYPKKKDKEAWDYFQILECCHYLNQQQGSGHAPLATLVTGSTSALPPTVQGTALAKGINIEEMEAFVSKWRVSSKSQG